MNQREELLRKMNGKTFEWLRTDTGDAALLSWGYNRNIFRGRDYAGINPDYLRITNYNSSMFQFDELSNYEQAGCTQHGYLTFCTTREVQECRAKGNDRDRYAVSGMQVLEKDGHPEISLQIRRTKWAALLYSWRHLRPINGQHLPMNRKTAVRNIHANVFSENAEQRFLLNSLCLHLIIEDKNGNVVLSRVSGSKKNDYPNSFAATIGEQLSLRDFYDPKSGEIYPDFVSRMTKRALQEEFGLPDSEFSGAGRLVDMDSLRVLSIDFEGYLYNIAVSATVRMNLTVQEMNRLLKDLIDKKELSEFRSCTLQQICNTLSLYPENRHRYHPSAYLQLLMFYLYKTA